MISALLAAACLTASADSEEQAYPITGSCRLRGKEYSVSDSGDRGTAVVSARGAGVRITDEWKSTLIAENTGGGTAVAAEASDGAFVSVGGDAEARSRTYASAVRAGSEGYVGIAGSISAEATGSGALGTDCGAVAADVSGRSLVIAGDFETHSSVVSAVSEGGTAVAARVRGRSNFSADGVLSASGASASGILLGEGGDDGPSGAFARSLDISASGSAAGAAVHGNESRLFIEENVDVSGAAAAGIEICGPGAGYASVKGSVTVIGTGSSDDSSVTGIRISGGADSSALIGGDLTAIGNDAVAVDIISGTAIVEGRITGIVKNGGKLYAGEIDSAYADSAAVNGYLIGLDSGDITECCTATDASGRSLARITADRTASGKTYFIAPYGGGSITLTIVRNMGVRYLAGFENMTDNGDGSYTFFYTTGGMNRIEAH